MSKGDAARRDEVVARLEALQYELRVESLTLYERIDTSGNSTIGVSASPLPDKFAFEQELGQKRFHGIQEAHRRRNDHPGCRHRTHSGSFTPTGGRRCPTQNPCNVLALEDIYRKHSALMLCNAL